MTHPTKPLDIEARELLAKHCDEGTAEAIRFGSTVIIDTAEALSAISELLTRLREVEEERDALKAAKWDVKHTDTMNDMVAMGLARDYAEQKLSNSQSLLEECREVLKPFAEEAREWLSTTRNDTPVMTMGPSDSDPTVSEFTLGDLRRAASLIEKLEGK